MPVDTVVLANELLDNLPFGIAEWDGARWQEVRVAVDGRRLRRDPRSAADDDAGADARRRRSRPAVRTRLPIPRGIEEWFDACGRACDTGVVVCSTTSTTSTSCSSSRRRGCAPTGRTNAGIDPLDAPGEQDITADVVLEQLDARRARRVLARRATTTQAEWLRDLGIDELVAEGRRTWEAGAARGDLEALAGRSRVTRSRRAHRPAGPRRAPRRHVLSKPAAPRRERR